MYFFSVGATVWEAETIGLSVQSGNGWDSNAPRPYVKASHDTITFLNQG